MAEHAKLSASGSYRWINCPGSVSLESEFKDKSSIYAEEGTLAHSVGELKLKKYFIKGFGAKSYKKAFDEYEASEFWSSEMDQMTDIYFEEIKRKALSFPTEPFVSIEDRVDFSAWVPEGFGTADCVMVYGDELFVIDLKYGKGVPVSPVENSQLMLYGLGAYNAYSWIYEIRKITLCIVQPRLDNIEYWSLTKEELLEFGEKIRPIANEAFNGSERFCEGEHCRFCKAKSRCPARADTMFSVVEEIRENIETKPLLSNAEIGAYLAKCEGVVDWIKDLQEEALRVLLEGEEVPGYKVVEGRSNRKIVDDLALAERLLSQGFEEAMIYKPKTLETITHLEKMVGKKEFKEISGDLVVKPQGKPTLVPETDKRPVYVKDASDMFNKILN